MIGRHIVTALGTSGFGEGYCFVHNLGAFSIHNHFGRACICFLTPKYMCSQPQDSIIPCNPPHATRKGPIRFVILNIFIEH
jgi:hypothetical protein